jgi:nucleoside-diphosphate-sugar epimerase
MDKNLGGKTPTRSENESSISLLGCGWLGIALAPALIERGFHVRGSTTQSGKLSTLTSLGIEAHLLRIEPLGEDESQFHSARTDSFYESPILIVNLPPETALGPDYHPGQLKEILTQLHPADGFKHLLYVSSSSVYGSAQGEVDEATEPQPEPGSGEILLACERMLMQAAEKKGFGLTIVRPAGLIGPGRHPGLFLAGRKNVRDGEGVVNMIHQLDLVAFLAELATQEVRPGEVRVFNAAAGAHPTRREFYTVAAGAVGVEAPTFQTSTSSTPKLVRSEKIREATGVKPKYDDLYSSFGAKKP